MLDSGGVVLLLLGALVVNTGGVKTELWVLESDGEDVVVGKGGRLIPFVEDEVETAVELTGAREELLDEAAGLEEEDALPTRDVDESVSALLVPELLMRIVDGPSVGEVSCGLDGAVVGHCRLVDEENVDGDCVVVVLYATLGEIEVVVLARLLEETTFAELGCSETSDVEPAGWVEKKLPEEELDDTLWAAEVDAEILLCAWLEAESNEELGTWIDDKVLVTGLAAAELRVLLCDGAEEVEARVSLDDNTVVDEDVDRLAIVLTEVSRLL